MSENLITIENLDVNKLPELQGMKEQQIKLVEENPYIEIIDNKTFEEAKKRRTTLLKGRTSLESQDKLIASKLTNFRKQVGNVTKELIEITLPHEEKQQEEVKRYEQVKENERLEKERLEQERIDNIKNKISDFESYAIDQINKWGVSVLTDPEIANEFEEDLDYEFEEFDILYQQAKTRVIEFSKSKFNSIQEKENQRLENERLAREKAESDAKLEAIQNQQEKERLEREQKEREEKEKVFEIRKNRLAEIGLASVQNKFVHADEVLEIYKNKVYHADVIDFENIIIDAKKAIQDAKERFEKEKAEKEAREKAEIEAKKKADKESKERVKRLAKDKAIYKKVLNDTLGSFPIVFDADQVEIREFSELASNRVEELKNKLLTELENL
ncbi:hypothetical protein [Flavobacterium phage FCOV-F14]|uniref:DUF1351 domain-containing protein n=8 Tax=Ficleduovirus FCL2 TaxID=2560473 RepID=A0A0A0YNQ3_9CAUD|nr:hypothetical protein ABG42_gp45 [Flavobacterium phage FCL-2]QCW21156.1 hypothetical protein [Flavobacterium phage FCOV-F13]QCW21230.1 hypothetical protein [Flavobacterium phage FCOV-F16]QCW21532.1 hypothetical protein [Flavobacterium phage FCOV-F45]QCW21606.1 hypothetical protein [Flavobacterium phage FCOV-F46]QCW21680.1 hypothetical protein [Flavobacterium phage FCOV-F54]QNJ51702.1 hypothetical protein [Flavobacterium phage FCOV-F14]QNJ51776.1 hypothetical protein [Flavobacterium phage F